MLFARISHTRVRPSCFSWVTCPGRVDFMRFAWCRPPRGQAPAATCQAAATCQPGAVCQSQVPCDDHGVVPRYGWSAVTGLEPASAVGSCSGGWPRWVQVASTDPAMMSANDAAIVAVNGSDSTATPAATATAGLM